jgi:hypothetical protein
VSETACRSLLEIKAIRLIRFAFLFGSCLARFESPNRFREHSRQVFGLLDCHVNLPLMEFAQTAWSFTVGRRDISAEKQGNISWT